MDEFVQAELVGEPLDAVLAPPTPQPDDGSHGIARAGKNLIVRPGAVFPDRCIRCNQPANGCRLKRTCYWLAPAWFFLILAGVLAYMIAWIFLRRKIEVHFPYCTKHDRQRRLVIVGLIVGISVGVICLSHAREQNHADGADLIWYGVGAGVIFTTSILCTFVFRQLRIARIDKEGFATFKGVSPEFLASLKEAGHRLDGTRVPPL